MNRRSMVNGVIGGIIGMIGTHIWFQGEQMIGATVIIAWLVGMANSLIPPRSI